MLLTTRLNDYDKDTLLKLTPLNQNIQVPFKQTNEIVKYVLDNYHQLNKNTRPLTSSTPNTSNKVHWNYREIVESCL